MLILMMPMVRTMTIVTMTNQYFLASDNGWGGLTCDCNGGSTLLPFLCEYDAWSSWIQAVEGQQLLPPTVNYEGVCRTAPATPGLLVLMLVTTLSLTSLITYHWSPRLWGTCHVLLWNPKWEISTGCALVLRPAGPKGHTRCINRLYSLTVKCYAVTITFSAISAFRICNQPYFWYCQ